MEPLDKPKKQNDRNDDGNYMSLFDYYKSSLEEKSHSDKESTKNSQKYIDAKDLPDTKIVDNTKSKQTIAKQDAMQFDQIDKFIDEVGNGVNKLFDTAIGWAPKITQQALKDHKDFWVSAEKTVAHDVVGLGKLINNPSDPLVAATENAVERLLDEAPLKDQDALKTVLVRGAGIAVTPIATIGRLLAGLDQAEAKAIKYFENTLIEQQLSDLGEAGKKIVQQTPSEWGETAARIAEMVAPFAGELPGVMSIPSRLKRALKTSKVETVSNAGKLEELTAAASGELDTVVTSVKAELLPKIKHPPLGDPLDEIPTAMHNRRALEERRTLVESDMRPGIEIEDFVTVMKKKGEILPAETFAPETVRALEDMDVLRIMERHPGVAIAEDIQKMLDIAVKDHQAFQEIRRVLTNGVDEVRWGRGVDHATAEKMSALFNDIEEASNVRFDVSPEAEVPRIAAVSESPIIEALDSDILAWLEENEKILQQQLREIDEELPGFDAYMQSKYTEVVMPESSPIERIVFDENGTREIFTRNGLEALPDARVEDFVRIYDANGDLVAAEWIPDPSTGRLRSLLRKSDIEKFAKEHNLSPEFLERVATANLNEVWNLREQIYDLCDFGKLRSQIIAAFNPLWEMSALRRDGLPSKLEGAFERYYRTLIEGDGQ